MAAKAAEPEKPAEPKDPFPPLDRGVDENGLRWEEVDVLGTRYRIREATVQDEDDAVDASENPDGETFNARLRARLLLAAAIVSPPTTVDDMLRWSGVKMRSMTYVFNRLNTLPPADAEGNG